MKKKVLKYDPNFRIPPEIHAETFDKLTDILISFTKREISLKDRADTVENMFLSYGLKTIKIHSQSNPKFTTDHLVPIDNRYDEYNKNLNIDERDDAYIEKRDIEYHKKYRIKTDKLSNNK